MTPSFNAARLIAAGRRAVPWLVGAAALTLRGPSLELTSPSPCPGLLELTSIASLRLNLDLPVATVIEALQSSVVVSAIAAFVALVARSTRNMAVSAAIGVAVALSPLFGRALSPPWEVAAFGACAIAALVLSSALATGRRSSRAVVVAGAAAFLLAALLVPPWLAVAAIGAAVVAAAGWPGGNHRTLAAIAAAAAVLLIVLPVLSLSRPDVLAGTASWRGLMACALPRPSPASTLAAIGTLGWWLGPLAFGLAALGAIAQARSIDARRAVWTALAALAGTALAAGAHLTAQVAVAPLAAALWWLAAIGLDTFVTAAGRGAAGWAVAAVLLLLLPALENSRRVNEPRDDRVLSRGHESQTLRRMTATLDLVAQDATFVEEDATVDMLLRAAVFRGRRRGKPVSAVAPEPEAIARLLGRRTVYAFPRRQADLSLRGLVVEPADAETAGAAALEGLAVITGTRRCDAVGAAWGGVSSASGRIGVVADGDATIGPVLMYFGGAIPSGAIPDGWPLRTLRGFHARTFDRRDPADATRLQAEARDEGLTQDHPVLTEPAVVRLTLHRTPRAPLASAVALGAPFPIGAARFEQGTAAVGRFIVCDSPPLRISPLPRR